MGFPGLLPRLWESDAGLLTSTAPGPPLAGITVNSLVPFAAAEAYAIAEPSGDQTTGHPASPPAIRALPLPSALTRKRPTNRKW